MRHKFHHWPYQVSTQTFLGGRFNRKLSPCKNDDYTYPTLPNNFDGLWAPN